MIKRGINVVLIRFIYKTLFTVCPRSSDPFYIVSYYIKWVTTSWTDGSFPMDVQWLEITLIANAPSKQNKCALLDLSSIRHAM